MRWACVEMRLGWVESNLNIRHCINIIPCHCYHSNFSVWFRMKSNFVWILYAALYWLTKQDKVVRVRDLLFEECLILILILILILTEIKSNGWIGEKRRGEDILLKQLSFSLTCLTICLSACHRAYYYSPSLSLISLNILFLFLFLCWFCSSKFAHHPLFPISIFFISSWGP